jgi:hypothetical protein
LLAAPGAKKNHTPPRLARFETSQSESEGMLWSGNKSPAISVIDYAPNIGPSKMFFICRVAHLENASMMVLIRSTLTTPAE